MRVMSFDVSSLATFPALEAGQLPWKYSELKLDQFLYTTMVARGTRSARRREEEKTNKDLKVSFDVASTFVAVSLSSSTET